MQYIVIHPGGDRYGPVELDELQRWIDDGRVLRDTQIEEQPSGRTVPAHGVLGLRFGANTAPPRVGQDAYFRPGAVVPVPNHLTKAILSMLCCCLPIGVVALVYAAQVDGFARSGNTDAAWSASRNADTWGNAAILLGVLSGCAYMGFAGVAGSM